MKAIDALKAEHRLIEWVLQALNSGVNRLVSGEQPHPGHYQAVIDFFREFIQGCHLPKEERVLFSAFKRHGVPEENGPIGLLMEEHARGRRMVTRLQDVLDRVRRGDASAQADWIETARKYSMLLAGHILKEDQILFPMGERVIPTEIQSQIWEVFESEEYAESGQVCCDDFLKKALLLADQSNVSANPMNKGR